MSKKRLSGATQPERREWASQIKALRQAAGMKQDELATQANVSRVTISNIERGTTVPQEDVLRRILTVLGVETDEVQFEQQTELWLTMLGTLIEAVPERRRPPVVDGAVRVIAAAIKAGDTDEGSAPVTPLRPVGPLSDTDATAAELPYAADTQNQAPDEDLRTP